MKMMVKKPGRDTGMFESEMDLSYHLRYSVSFEVDLFFFHVLLCKVKSYAEEHQPRISLGNKNIFSLRFCRNKNIDFDSGKTSKI